MFHLSRIPKEKTLIKKDLTRFNKTSGVGARDKIKTQKLRCIKNKGQKIRSKNKLQTKKKAGKKIKIERGFFRPSRGPKTRFYKETFYMIWDG